MSRLIDADSLLQVIRKNIPKNQHDEYQEGQGIGLSMAVEMVCNEPTVDAEPIIRCEDCKYFMHGLGCVLQGEDYTWEEQMYADDFCSRGEKKDETD